MDTKHLKIQAKNQLSGRWTLAVFTILVANFLNGLLSYNEELYDFNFAYLSISFSILYIILGGVIQTGKCRFLINMIYDKENAKFTDLFSQFGIFFKTLGLNLLITLIIALGSLLLVIPGIIFSYMYSQSFYILAENPEMSITDCMRASRNLMYGHKGSLFYLQLTFVGWYIIGVLTLGIALLWINPYFDVTCTNFYLSIKDKAILH